MEIPAGVSFFYANNEPKSALARDLGDCRDNKGKLAKRVFTCYNRKFRGIPCYTKGTDMPMMRTRAKTDVNYRFFLKNSSAFRNMIPSARSFDIPFSRKYS